MQNSDPKLPKTHTQNDITLLVCTEFSRLTEGQILQELGIKHMTSSAYHPQSFGALKCFHQALKSMLKKYSLENSRDSDERVPFALFDTRKGVCPYISVVLSESLALKCKGHYRSGWGKPIMRH